MIIPGLSSVSSLQPHCTALSTWTSDASQLSQEHGTFSCSKPLIDGYLRKIRSICPISTTRTTSQPEPEHSVYRAVRRAGQQVALQEMSCSSSNRSFTVVLKGFQQWKPALLHKLLCHLQGISDIRLTQWHQPATVGCNYSSWLKALGYQVWSSLLSYCSHLPVDHQLPACTGHPYSRSPSLGRPF